MFFRMFDTWADALKMDRPKLADTSLRQFRDRMYGGDFVFNVSRDFVRSCRTPMLILCGNDDYHPMETSKDIAALAPNAELVENWKAPEVIGATVKRVREFLIAHTPKS
jgi:pimeloyl-ACP methyl ester carboxylesterase